MLGAATSSVTCHVASLAKQVGGSPIAFAEVVGTVAPSVLEGTSLTATATATPTGTATDPNLNNNSATTAPTVVHAFANLSIAKSRSTNQTCPDPNSRGGPSVPCAYANADATQNAIVYTVTVTNAGPSDAQDVTITDSLDSAHVEKATYCKVLPDTSCAPLGTYTGTINQGTLPPSTVEYRITAHAIPSLRDGAIPTLNHASVSSRTLRTDGSANDPDASRNARRPIAVPGTRGA